MTWSHARPRSRRLRSLDRRLTISFEPYSDISDVPGSSILCDSMTNREHTE